MAKASSYYPWKMVVAVTRAVIESWKKVEDDMGISLANGAESYLLQIEKPSGGDDDLQKVRELREEDPQILALTRNRFPAEPPTGKRSEQIRQQMLRIHRASGHTSFTNLQRLLRMRKAPPWAIDLAGKMSCSECIESKKPRPRPQPPAALSSTPGLYEILGTDVFEYEHQNEKFKYILWRDRASGLVMVDELKIYGAAPRMR